MTNADKKLLFQDLCGKLPYEFSLKIAIDFKGYLEWLSADEEVCRAFKKRLYMYMEGIEENSIEKLSLKPFTLALYPCYGRFTTVEVVYVEDFGFPVEFIKPYLRPMSSMTEEEKRQLIENTHIDYVDENVIDFGEFLCEGSPVPVNDLVFIIDWLNAHHFDIRNLIQEGLALEAPEGMYN